MIEPTAQLICRKTKFGPVCRWEGGKFAYVNAETIRYPLGHESRRIESGMVFTFGRVRMRVVSFPIMNSCALYCDNALVMLESPHAQLYWLYREHAEKAIRLVAQIEMRVWGAWRGLRLRPLPEGELLRFTGWLADRLL